MSDYNARPMREVVVKSPLPYYITGGFSVLYSLVFPLYRLSDFLLFAALCLFVYILCSKLISGKKIMVPVSDAPITTGNKEIDSQLADGMQYLKQIREANDKIADPAVSAQLFRMEQSCRKIFEHLGKNKNKVPQMRKFLNYYLPTLLKLLNYHIELKSQNIAGENISAGIRKIEGILQTIADAFDRQLDALFAEDTLDISTDITVLESMLAQEGLANTSIKNKM